MLVREAMAQGSADLKFAGIKSPNLDASLLLAHVLNVSREKLIAAGNEKIPLKACAQFCELIERRCNGECVAYITGKKEFRGLEFTVNPSVLVPRPDTETLVEAALQILSSVGNNLKVLDLCTGSGAVAISLKHEKPELDVYAADISLGALETAKENAKKNPCNEVSRASCNEVSRASCNEVSRASCNEVSRARCDIINFYHGDLFEALPSSAGLFNMIVSNPPYIPSNEIETLSPEVKNEPRLALDGGETGLDIIKRIIEKAPQYLQNSGSSNEASRGYLVLEADPRQMEEIILMLEKRRFYDIKLYKDLAGDNRVISGRYEE